MAETEKRDDAQRDIELMIAEVRGRQGGMDAKAALDILVEKLKHSTGYYTWAPLGEGFEQVWQCRIPREDLNDETWLKEESADLLHICRPVKFLEAVEARDKEGSSDYCGYVRDENGKATDDGTMKCARCKREMPEKLAKAGIVQLKLHRLGRVR